jgi:sugar lactone lactonase YvrE
MSSAIRRRTLVATAIAAFIAAAVPSIAGAKQAFLARFHATTTLASAVPKSGTAMGDVNPYGVAVVPRTMGSLTRGDVLVSNFNNAANQQGTGSSIVEISPSGNARVFAVVPRPTGTNAVGLTTALVVLRSGYVIVGSLPAPGGTASAARAGALTILNSNGRVVETLKGGPINGPWDMTALDHGASAVLFVTNVLNGTVAAKGKNVDKGTVVRITLQIGFGHAPRVTGERVIATGFREHTDPNALVVGPTGVGLAGNGALYVADSARNRIAVIPTALTRTTVAQHGGTTVTKGGQLNDPLGLAVAPNGDILTTNGSDGNIVETTAAGVHAATVTLVPSGAGDLFGLAVAPGGSGVYFVNDAGSGPAANSLDLLH